MPFAVAYVQNLDPLGARVASTFVAALPVLVLFYLLVGRLWLRLRISPNALRRRLRSEPGPARGPGRVHVRGGAAGARALLPARGPALAQIEDLPQCPSPSPTFRTWTRSGPGSRPRSWRRCRCSCSSTCSWAGAGSD